VIVESYTYRFEKEQYHSVFQSKPTQNCTS
jgi:hypothetical protein